MRIALRTFAILLAAFYTSAASNPCPGEKPSTDARPEQAVAAVEMAHHASHHGHGESDQHASPHDRSEHSTSEAVFSSPCLCGCQDGATSKAVPGSPLGATLLAAMPFLPVAIGESNRFSVEPRFPGSPNPSVEPIPI